MLTPTLMRINQFLMEDSLLFPFIMQSHMTHFGIKRGYYIVRGDLYVYCRYPEVNATAYCYVPSLHIGTHGTLHTCLSYLITREAYRGIF